MLNIIACDDDSFTLQMISTLLNQAITESNVEARLVCLTAAGQELLQFVRNTGGSYLYFLDFDLGREELNGIDLVRRIYQLDSNGQIVFVSSHTDKGMDILRSGVRALGFIEKVIDQKKMIREYVRYIRLAESSNIMTEKPPSIELPISIDEMVELPLSSISYVDSVKTVAHSICFHTFDGSEITVRDTIEHAQEQLGDGFVRCHRSVLVNQNNVVSLKNGMIKLSNGFLVPCALGRRKYILETCLGGKEKHND